MDNNWISVKDRLPKLEDNVLFVTHTDWDTYVCYGVRLISCWFDDYNDKIVDKSVVTHWMPLPEPPEEDGI